MVYIVDVFITCLRPQYLGTALVLGLRNLKISHMLNSMFPVYCCLALAVQSRLSELLLTGTLSQQSQCVREARLCDPL